MTTPAPPASGDGQTTTTPTEPPAPTPAPPANAGSGAPARLPDDHPLVRAFNATKTELAAARNTVKQFEDANKTDLERATGERDSEKARADTAEAEAARMRSALKHGLSIDDLDLLGNGTADEIEARAARLAERLGGATPPPPATPPASRHQGREGEVKGGVSAGRDLWQERHPKATTSS